MKTSTRVACLGLAIVLVAAVLSGCGGAAADTDYADFSYSEGLTDQGFFEGVTASEIVTLPEYKGITIPGAVQAVSQEDIDTQVDSILANYAEKSEVTDRAVADGDTINIDYIGKVDGVAFEGGDTKGNGTEVTIGVTSYIDDFLEQLIGHTPGETFDIQVTFPEVYEQNQELAGKEAVFTVTINHIVASILPELTNTIAADFGFDTSDELIADITDWLVTQQQLDYFQTMMASATCEKIPDAVLQYVIHSEMYYYAYYAQQNNLELDDFFASNTGYASIDAYLEANQAMFEQTAVYFLAIQAIAELEGLTVSDAAVTAAGMDEYATQYGNGYLRMYLLQNEVVPGFVFDNAVIA